MNKRRWTPLASLPQPALRALSLCRRAGVACALCGVAIAAEALAAPPPDLSLRAASAAADNGQLARAEQQAVEALNAARARGDEPAQWRAAALVGRCYLESGRFADALRAAEPYVAARDLSADSAAAATARRGNRRELLLILAEAATDLENYTDAERRLAAALEISTAKQDDPLVALDILERQARLAVRRGEADLAQRRWQRVMELAKQQLERLPAAGRRREQCAAALRAAYRGQNDLQAAASLAEQAAGAAAEHRDARQQVQALLQLAEVRAAQHDAAARVTALRQARRLYAQVRPVDPAGEADVAMRLGDALQASGNFAAARDQWRAAAALYDTLVAVEPHSEAEVQRRVALLSRLQVARQQLGDWQSAAAVARRLLAYREERLDPVDPRLYRTRTSLGMYLGALGQLDAAHELLAGAVAYWRTRQPAGARELVGALGNLAVVDRDRGSFGAALKELDEALLLAGAHLPADDLLLAETLVNRATVRAAAGQFATALDDYQAASKIFHESGPLAADRLAATLLNVAVVHASQRHEQQALEAAQQALRLYEQVSASDDPALVGLQVALAGIYTNQSQWSEAESALEQALRICRVHFQTPPRQLGQVLYQQGLLAFRRQPANLPGARAAWQAALPLAVQAGDRTLQARMLNYLGELAAADGELPEAARLLEESAQLQDALAAFPALHYATLCNQAEVLYQQQDAPAAIAVLRRAIDLVESPRARTSGGEQERARYFAQFSVAYDRLVDWLIEGGEPAEALAVADRARNRTLHDQIRAAGVDLAVTLAGTAAAQLVSESRDLDAKIAGLERVGQMLDSTGASTERLAQFTTQLSALRSEQARLWTEIRSASPFYRDLLAHDPAARLAPLVQGKLAATQPCVLSYYLGAQHGYVFVFGSNAGELTAYPLTISAEDATELGVEEGLLNRPLAAALVNRWLQVLSKPPVPAGERGLGTKVVSRKATFSGPQALAFANIVLPAAVRERVASSGAPVLTILSDGALADLPFETLPMDADRFALDVLPAIDYAPSATILASLLSRPAAAVGAAPSVVTLGDPKTVGSAFVLSEQTDSKSPGAAWQRRLAPLPFALAECQRVARTFGSHATMLTGTKATQLNLLAAVRQQSHAGRPWFLHLAAHAIVDEKFDNLFGAIALAPDAGDAAGERDGLLTLQEIYTLPLTGCELAVLSACETALGPERPLEAGSSLARAFLAAGAERVVSSHWKVDDQATAELIGSFCEHLARTGAEPKATVHYAAALRQAQRGVAHHAQHPEWASPYYWGSFTLLGPADSLPRQAPHDLSVR